MQLAVDASKKGGPCTHRCAYDSLTEKNIGPSSASHSAESSRPSRPCRSQNVMRALPDGMRVWLIGVALTVDSRDGRHVLLRTAHKHTRTHTHTHVVSGQARARGHNSSLSCTPPPPPLHTASLLLRSAPPGSGSSRQAKAVGVTCRSARGRPRSQGCSRDRPGRRTGVSWLACQTAC